MDFENQKMLETFFNARQTPKLLRKELLDSPAVVKAIQASELDEEFALDLMAHMILAKRAPVTALIGMLNHHFESESDKYQATADAITQAVIKDLVDWDPMSEQIVLRFDADAGTHELIKQYQYMPPMIVPPLRVDGNCGQNRGSGYLTIRTDSLILKDAHHDGELCCDSLNRFNSIPLKLNMDVATQVNNTWRNIDKPKDDESYEDYQKRVKAFNRYQKDTAFTMALMMETGNRFYITHKYDKRGRTYAQGYHINPQGNCWNKAVIELADEEALAE